MAESKIEWTDATWNPVRGCSRVSSGCDNCYAMGQARRFDTPPVSDPSTDASLSKPAGAYHGLTTIRNGKIDWAGHARFVPEMLDAPLRWKKHRRIFVNSMSDLFHHSVTNEQIAAVFGVMAACPQHTFQILSKRPERMVEWFEWIAEQDTRCPWCPWTECHAAALDIDDEQETIHRKSGGLDSRPWPLPNVWLGVSCEDQQRAEERIPLLLRCPAAVRFVSAEPLLGPIEIARFMWPVHETWPAAFPSPEAARAAGKTVTKHRQALVAAHARFIDWVIVGGESGPGARGCKLAWIRSIVEQCRDAGVACFVKQLGSRPEQYLPPRLKDRKGGDPSEWPSDLRVREFPEVRA